MLFGGVDVRFQVSTDQPTGVCAVLVNDKERSLCTFLGASLTFRLPANWMENASRARLLYAAGYAFSASPEVSRLRGLRVEEGSRALSLHQPALPNSRRRAALQAESSGTSPETSLPFLVEVQR